MVPRNEYTDDKSGAGVNCDGGKSGSRQYRGKGDLVPRLCLCIAVITLVWLPILVVVS